MPCARSPVPGIARGRGDVLRFAGHALVGFGVLLLLRRRWRIGAGDAILVLVDVFDDVVLVYDACGRAVRCVDEEVVLPNLELERAAGARRS